jgi:hypothetical protein
MDDERAVKMNAVGGRTRRMKYMCPNVMPAMSGVAELGQAYSERRKRRDSIVTTRGIEKGGGK